MVLTSVDVPLEVLQSIKGRGMTIRGALIEGLKLLENEPSRNGLLIEVQTENQRLKQKIEKLAIMLDEVLKK